MVDRFTCYITEISSSIFQHNMDQEAGDGCCAAAPIFDWYCRKGKVDADKTIFSDLFGIQYSPGPHVQP